MCLMLCCSLCWSSDEYIGIYFGALTKHWRILFNRLHWYCSDNDITFFSCMYVYMLVTHSNVQCLFLNVYSRISPAEFTEHMECRPFPYNLSNLLAIVSIYVFLCWAWDHTQHCAGVSPDPGLRGSDLSSGSVSEYGIWEIEPGPVMCKASMLSMNYLVNSSCFYFSRIKYLLNYNNSSVDVILLNVI